MSWPLNSVEPDVNSGLYLLCSAKEIWDTIQELHILTKKLQLAYMIHIKK